MKGRGSTRGEEEVLKIEGRGGGIEEERIFEMRVREE
jgi:hypothetical protein